MSVDSANHLDLIAAEGVHLFDGYHDFTLRTLRGRGDCRHGGAVNDAADSREPRGGEAHGARLNRRDEGESAKVGASRRHRHPYDLDLGMAGEIPEASDLIAECRNQFARRSDENCAKRRLAGRRPVPGCIERSLHEWQQFQHTPECYHRGRGFE
ncbi:MAG TPA: hypothetical protein VKP66_11770 [Steroidobacteraceae bacterium]|nr:hypothetical protein [Steroidobacteraceae bacterium]